MAPGTTHLVRGLHSQTGPPQLSGPIIVAGEEVQHHGPSQHLTLLSARKEQKDGVYLSHMPREPRGPGGRSVQSLSAGRQNPISVKKDPLSSNIHRKYSKW